MALLSGKNARADRNPLFINIKKRNEYPYLLFNALFDLQKKIIK